MGKMHSFKLIYLICVLNLNKTYAKISDKQLCFDKICAEPISKAKTILQYNSVEDGVFSFKANEDVIVYSYGAGKREDLWGVEINGKRGFAPKSFLKETKVFQKQVTELVDTETKNLQVHLVQQEQVIPQKSLAQHEVIDGTTIYLEDPDIAPSTTDRSVIPTATLSIIEDLEKPVHSPPLEKIDSEKVDIEDTENDDNFDEDTEDDEDGDEHEDENEEEEADSIKQENGKSPSAIPINTNLVPDRTPLPSTDSHVAQKKVPPSLSDNLKPEILAQDSQTKENVILEIPIESTPLLHDPKVTSDLVGIISENNIEPERSADHNNVKQETVSTSFKVPLSQDVKEDKEKGVLPQDSSIKGSAIFEPPVEDTPLLNNQKITSDSVGTMSEYNIEPKRLPDPTHAKQEKVSIASEVPLSQDFKEGQEKGVLLQDSSSKENASFKPPVENTTLLRDPKITSDSVGIISGNNTEPERSAGTTNLKSETVSSSTELPVSQNVKEVQSETLEKYNISLGNLSDLIFQSSNQEKLILVNENQNLNGAEEAEKLTNVPKMENVDSLPVVKIEETKVETLENLDNNLVDSSMNEETKQLEVTEIHRKDKDEMNFENTSESVGVTQLENETPFETWEINTEDLKNSDFSAAQTPVPPTETSNQDVDNASTESGGIISNIMSFFGNDVEGSVEDDVKEGDASVSEINNKDNDATYNEPVTKQKDEADQTNYQDDGTDNKEPNTVNKSEAVQHNSQHVSIDQTQNPSEVVAEKYPQYDSIPNQDFSQNGNCNAPGVDCNPKKMMPKSQENLPDDINTIDAREDNENEDIVEEDDSVLGMVKNFLPFKFNSLLLFDDFHSDIFLYLITTAISVTLFLFGYLAMDKSKRVEPLIARINKLEQQLLVSMKENEMLQESSAPLHVKDVTQITEDKVPNEEIEQLTQKLAEMHISKTTLEEQIQALEKELDTSTEVGMELNKIVSEMLNSSNNGSDVIKESIEQMKRQLLDQQETINSVNQSLSFAETENHELRLDLDISNKKVSDLQVELDKMLEKLLKIEEEKDQQQNTLEQEIVLYQQKYKEAVGQGEHIQNEIQVLRSQLSGAIREADIKVREYNELKNSLKDIKSIKNNSEAMKSLLEVSSVKAELQQIRVDSNKFKEQLRLEQEAHLALGKRYQLILEETNKLREKYEFADKEKVEVMTKLEVLNNYFKEKESQLQKEISNYESLWVAKEGEATSTTERIKYMQDELQNYKSQNETLKQEIMNQEVQLKSQISVLEKKVHENWVTNRQLERKLEEAKQEAAQLRNRLTLSERSVTEGNAHMRILSPLQNGELPFSPPPIETPASPPPLFSGRDHSTKSPPLPGLPPPPFLPPPIGGPFMPSHLPGMPPFMLPPPSMFPGDHRPPPLGRMSSPLPMMMRYSPDSTAYSGYDRNSPSPPYDSEYRTSPPPMRSYSPYEREDRREYKRPNNRSNGRNNKGSTHLNSGSGRSNDS